MPLEASGGSRPGPAEEARELGSGPAGDGEQARWRSGLSLEPRTPGPRAGGPPGLELSSVSPLSADSPHVGRTMVTNSV